jgi:hypothetical protein
MIWWLAMLIGGAAGFIFSQTQKLTGGTQSMAIAVVAGAVAGWLGSLLLGWLGEIVGQIAVAAAVGGLAVYALKQGNVLK